MAKDGFAAGEILGEFQDVCEERGGSSKRGDTGEAITVVVDAFREKRGR